MRSFTKFLKLNVSRKSEMAISWIFELRSAVTKKIFMHEQQSAVISKTKTNSKHFHNLFVTVKQLHLNFSCISGSENSKTIRYWVNQIQLSVVSCWVIFRTMLCIEERKRWSFIEEEKEGVYNSYSNVADHLQGKKLLLFYQYCTMSREKI